MKFQLSEKIFTPKYNWEIIIFSAVIATIFITIYCLAEDINTVFTHLYYIPIILLAYRYQKQGVLYGALLALLYFLLILFLEKNNPIEIFSALIRFFVFIAVAIVVAYLSSTLKQKNHEIKRINHFNESIISNANVWLMVLDRNERIVVWNKAAEAISGYPSIDVLGNNLIWKKLYPDQKYRREITQSILEHIQDNESLEHFQTTILTRDGRTKTISWNTRAIPDENGDFNQFIAIGIDITARIAAENALQDSYEQLMMKEEELRQQLEDIRISHKALWERESEYRNILRTAMDGFCIIDMQGRLMDANKAFCQMIGYTHDEISSLSVTDIDVKKSESEIAEQMEKVIRKGEDQFETRYRKKNGDIIDVEVSAVYSHNDQGHFITFHRDITERKRSEKALHQAGKKLNVLNLFTINEIQTAVFNLHGYLELEKDLRPAGETNFLSKEIEQVQTITDSLVFARSYQNLGIKPPKWHNVNQVFLFAISHLDYSTITRRVNVNDLEIFADPLLETVFFKLAENVIQHGKTVNEVTLSYEEKPEGLLLIFTDNGPGIPESTRKNLFKRDTANMKGKGLFLVREILEITEIGITENGVPGEGARFEMSIPPDAYRFGHEDEDTKTDIL